MQVKNKISLAQTNSPQWLQLFLLETALPVIYLEEKNSLFPTTNCSWPIINRWQEVQVLAKTAEAVVGHSKQFYQ